MAKTEFSRWWLVGGVCAAAGAAVAATVPSLERFAPGRVETQALCRPDAQFAYLHDNAVFAFGKRLFVAWYNCPKDEMSGNSVIRGRWSDDGGRTWNDVRLFAGDPAAKPAEGNGAFMYVPPAFGSDGTDLFLFASRMVGPDQVRDCEIFRWDAAVGRFAAAGLMDCDFIPNANALPRTDGRWMVPGRRFAVRGKERWPSSRPTLAISETADMAGKWRFVDLADEFIPGTKIKFRCSEPALVAEGRNLTAYVRAEDYGAPGGCGLRVFESSDEGETWRLAPNLPFRLSPAKPAAGLLPDGRRYLIANPHEEGGRLALALYLAEKGSKDFTRAFLLQRGDEPAAGLSHEWCYPSACVHGGKLWVAASACAGGTAKNASGLMAVPLAALDDPKALAPARLAGLRTDQLVEPFGVTGAPTFSWRVDGVGPAAEQTAYRIEVFARGAERPTWDSGGVASGDARAVRYGGPALRPATHYRWRVRVKTAGGEEPAPAEAAFSTGLAEDFKWNPQWFVTAADKRGADEPDTTVVVKTLENAKDVAEAWWFATAMGTYRAYVNGAEVQGELKLKPGYTTLERRRQYFSADVTALVKRGRGARNVFCGEVTSTWWTRMYPWTLPVNENAFSGVLLLRYADGTEETVPTDGSWKAAYAGPVVEASLFGGEVHDARVGTPWRAAGAPEGWKNARTTHHAWAAGAVTPLTGPPVAWREDLKRGCADHYAWKGATGFATNAAAGRVEAWGRVNKLGRRLRIEPGEEIVFDFWQNAAAVPEMKWRGAAGTRATLRFAEMLNDGNGETARGNDGPGGSLYLRNLRQAKARAEYVFAGAGVEEYVPAFTFFGYRYMSVRADGPIEVVSAQTIPICSIPREDETGFLVTGDAGVNKLVSNVLWGQRSNYLSVPTDCPQRDERQGWSADTQVFAAAGAYNANTYGFLSKWMVDLVDSSWTNGAFAFVAPQPRARHLGPSTGWSDAGVVVPHVLYRAFGDPKVLERSFAAMDRFMDVIFPDPTVKKPCTDFGDWLAFERNDEPLKNLISRAYLVWDAMMMRDAARALGRDWSKYAGMERRARADFREQHLDAQGELKPEFRCQTAYAFALDLDLVEGAARERTADALVANVAAHGGRLQTGFLGTPVLLRALVKADRADVAYTILLQHENPSWLYSVDQGATTIWERWNSYTKEKGFGDAGMNSFNHYAYGCVLQWLYEDAAGIRPDWDRPGFRHFTLEPHPDRRLGRIDARFAAPPGRIESAWDCCADGTVTYRFRVPPGTTATLRLPGEPVRELKPGRHVFTSPAAGSVE